MICRKIKCTNMETEEIFLPGQITELLNVTISLVLQIVTNTRWRVH